MTYLHTTPDDPESPLWLFHLPSFTLAQLHLGAGPAGHHLLMTQPGTPAPDEAVAAFAATLETMAPSASQWLTVIAAKESHAWDSLPPSMPFAPVKPGGETLTVYPRKCVALPADPFIPRQAT